MPIEISNSFILSALSGDANRGGWTASASFANDMDEAVYGRAAEVFTLAEGGGSWQDSYRLALSGTIIPQNVIFDRGQSNTVVTVSTADFFLNNAGLQGIYFAALVSPDAANPHQATEWTLAKIVKHIIEEHSDITIAGGGWVNTDGIDLLGSTSVDVYTVRQSNNTWNTIADISSNEFYVRYFTREDKFIYEPHPQYKAILPDPVLTFDKSNIVGQPELIFRTDVTIDQVQLYALTDTGVILTSNYPANVGTDGRRHKFSNLRCNSQARLNQLAERAYKFFSRDYDFRLTVAGAWGAYLELYDRVSITYTGTTENGVTLDWTDKKFWVRAVNVSRIGNFGATSEFTLEEENV